MENTIKGRLPYGIPSFILPGERDASGISTISVAPFKIASYFSDWRVLKWSSAPMSSASQSLSNHSTLFRTSLSCKLNSFCLTLSLTLLFYLFLSFQGVFPSHSSLAYSFQQVHSVSSSFFLISLPNPPHSTRP